MADLPHPRFVGADEYLRRNSVHANAVGAHANTKAALARLLKMKRPPMWLIGALEGIERRTAIVHPEVAKWRNSAPDNPYGVTAVPANVKNGSLMVAALAYREGKNGRAHDARDRYIAELEATVQALLPSGVNPSGEKQ